MPDLFTLDQIRAAHKKVKTGADFTTYVEDLIRLGVTKYDTHPSDGRCLYYGDGGFTLPSNSAYSALPVAEDPHIDQFIDYLKQHQLGETDYPAFCEHATSTGVEKWTVDFSLMTCTYFDKSGAVMLVESIP